MLELFIIKLLMCVIGLLVLALSNFIILRGFDIVSRRKFKGHEGAIEAMWGNPTALGIYYGLRYASTVIALALMVVVCIIL